MTPLPPGLPPGGPQPRSDLSEFRASPICRLTELEVACGRVSVIHWQTLGLPTQLTRVLELRHTPTVPYTLRKERTCLVLLTAGLSLHRSLLTACTPFSRLPLLILNPLHAALSTLLTPRPERDPPGSPSEPVNLSSYLCLPR